MKLEEKNPPRKYEVGFEKKRWIQDCGYLHLGFDEQVTLLTDDRKECDITRKSFGFYITPSTNGRLAQFGLRTVIARNRLNRAFVLLVEKGKEKQFEEYIQEEKMEILCWLDTDEGVSGLCDATSNLKLRRE